MQALFFDFPHTEGPKVPRAFLSLAEAGDMRYLRDVENPCRDDFLRGLSIDPSRFVGLELIHSRRVLTISPQANYCGKADGLFSMDSNVCLGITVSDCMPIWFYDRVRGGFGVLHSGWQGTGISLEALSLLERECGTSPRDLSFILGPSIGPCCYRVGPERAIQYMEAFGADAAQERDAAWFLDIPATNEGILRDAGVEHILRIDECTACSRRLGSFRRQGTQAFIRMLAGICWSAPLDRIKKSG